MDKRKKLKSELESIYSKYHHPEYTGLDPLICLSEIRGRKQLEVSAFLASCLAYGRVERIIHSIYRVFDIAKGDLYNFIIDTEYRDKKRVLNGFKHRFNNGEDISCLLETVKVILKRHGSLENMFTHCMNSSDPDMRHAMSGFAEEFHLSGMEIAEERRRSFEYLLPSPSNGSACKRFNMFLRWMVRKKDGIDFGLWKSVSPSLLVIPVDTHVLATSIRLGLTKRKSADWKTAQEITEKLKMICPEDPVKYDFSLCRYGMKKFRRACS